jgi:hypothetical protein
MATSQAMDPRVEQELARLLLTELLAYVWGARPGSDR